MRFTRQALSRATPLQREDTRDDDDNLFACLEQTLCQSEQTLCQSESCQPNHEATQLATPFAKGSCDSFKTCFTVENLLSDVECARLIALTTRMGYGKALVNVGGGRQIKSDDFRKSGRVMIDSPAFAAALFERLCPLLPERHNEGRGDWEPVCLNERMRFLRYEPGDYFKPHQDGSFARVGPESAPHGERSFLTLMIYLDTPDKGGETNFINHNIGMVTSVHPRTGLGLIFDHLLEHEGATLLRGKKHAIRTDVMFRRPAVPAPVPAPVPTTTLAPAPAPPLPAPAAPTPAALMEDGRFDHATCGMHPTLLARLRSAVGHFGNGQPLGAGGPGQGLRKAPSISTNLTSSGDSTALQRLCKELVVNAGSRLRLQDPLDTVSIIVAPPVGPATCVVGGCDPCVAVWLLLDPLDIDSKQTTFWQRGPSNMKWLYKWSGTAVAPPNTLLPTAVPEEE